MAEPERRIGHCRNCGARLQGEFCHECGQAARETRAPIWTALSISVQQTFGADARFWITLRKLLFHPGLLTIEFLEGKQRRSLHPLRLFLIGGVLVLLTPDLSRAERFAWPEAWSELAPAGASFLDRFELGKQRFLVWRAQPETSLEQLIAFSVEVNRSYLVWSMLGSLLATLVLLKLLRPRRLLYDHLVFLLHVAGFAYLSDALLRTVGVQSLAGGTQVLTVVQFGYTMLAFVRVYPITSWRPLVAIPFNLLSGALMFFGFELAFRNLISLASIYHVMPPPAAG